ncbi:type II toxin-antitoxin system RnlA family toxin [Sphingobacterium sp. HJSM2_6]|uniref:type II toxin-antitoxin system RnlA family toxin n=1 Tax=Sphingobacterium sp. HJSM2_6 TaxID=3366264 RepID=UPI003BE1B632
MKKLRLNRELYYNYIKSELFQEFQYTIEDKPNNLKIVKFIKTGEAQAQLNIYENNDGTTTLQYAVGQNQELSKKIAEELVSVSSIKEFKAHSFYIKTIRDEDFDAFVEIIVEFGNVIENFITEGNKTILTLRGKQGDKIVVTKHINNAFQVQGKPMLLFNEIIVVLSEFLAFDEIIQQQLKFYESNLTTADIRGELENRLPNICGLLEDKLKVIITPSLALQKMQVELEDYSAFAYPILRSIEGVLKQIFLKYGKDIDYKEGFGEYLIKEKSAYILEEEFRMEINNPAIETKICNLYKYYNIYRHSLFHIDDDVLSSKVITLQEANNIITTSLTLIDDCSICLN